MTTLFDPLRAGDIDLATRIVMAPLTRNRASPGQVPNELMREYYAQRADPASGAGLIVTEATQVCPEGQGYLDTPGIHSAEQVAGWRRITDAVHARGGRIVVQLWHVGRISHVSLQPGGQAPVSSTARPAGTKTYIAGGFATCSPPRALATEEIPGVVEQYRRAALNALEAGFDGVEVHGANGYLIDQFLRHLQRTRVLLHVVDLAPFDEAVDPVQQAKAIVAELKKFDPELHAKPRWLVPGGATKAASPGFMKKNGASRPVPPISLACAA